MFYAVIFLAGQAVAAIAVGDEATCGNLKSIMIADFDKGFEENAFGLATDTGTIYRRQHWVVDCLDHNPMAKG